MQIVKSGTEAFDAGLARIAARFNSLANELADEGRELAMRVYGEPLTPLQGVQRIISDVRRTGDTAVSLYTEKFDGVQLSPSEFLVPEDEVLASVDKVSPALMKAMRIAKENIFHYQQHIKPRAPRDIVLGEKTIGLRMGPLASAALYAPHGLAPYPSTVLMTAVPAKVAGVKRIVLCTPPRKDKSVPPEILAAAAECGVTEVYRVNGVAAIAMMAYGTQTVDRVDKIVGPGQSVIQLAKKEVFGAVGLDQFAGPTEILVIADQTANPAWVAADLLSQAEHNPDSSAILVTTEPQLAELVSEEVEKQIEQLSKKDVARHSIDNYGLIIVTDSLEQSIDIAEQIAPEHLELHIDQAERGAERIKNAGTIFIGPYAPEAVGDYIAGPSHVLPSGGTARFFSGLSVSDFMRQWSVTYYSRGGLRSIQDDITEIAESEGFDGHAKSARIRFQK